MPTCTFFGHSNAPDAISSVLKKQIIYLIEHKSVNKFYVGNHGHFDFLVRNILMELKELYDFNYFVVLAYLPTENQSNLPTIYPEGIETAPLRFAIDRRNRWMIKNSDYVLTYVKKSFGGAFKYKELAQKQNKTVLELSDI